MTKTKDARYVVIWEFQAKRGRKAEFERVYGPDGEWAQLFRRAEGYAGTELHRDVRNPGRYVTLDFWVSPAAYKAFRQRWKEEYQALDARCESLTDREAALGSFVRLGR